MLYFWVFADYYRHHVDAQDGMQWLMNLPEQNLPMILAENGFDVWIANARGTKYSRRHTSLNPSEPVIFLFHCFLFL